MKDADFRLSLREGIQRELAERWKRFPDQWGSYRRTCQVCGRAFYAWHPSARNCSYRCHRDLENAHQRAVRAAHQQPKHCINCGVAFTGRRSDAATCSTRRRVAAWRTAHSQQLAPNLTEVPIGRIGVQHEPLRSARMPAVSRGANLRSAPRPRQAH
jgi:predicted nucleic acid-binding Zn ribbon protein